MTGAPFVVKDQQSGKVLLVHGSSGDEFGVVGWLFARDPDTGEEVWARPLVEGHMGRLNGKDSTPTGDPNAPRGPATRTATWSRPGTTAAAPLADRQLRRGPQHGGDRRRQPRAVEHLAPHQGRRRPAQLGQPVPPPARPTWMPPPAS
jgi:hypothetical protein